MTLYEVFAYADSDYKLMFNNFTQIFLSTWDKSLVEKEPIWDESRKSKLIFAAAWVHYWTDVLKLGVPAWCLKERYIHAEPVWEGGEPSEYIRKLTPEQLVYHHLYYREFSLVSA